MDFKAQNRQDISVSINDYSININRLSYTEKESYKTSFHCHHLYEIIAILEGSEELYVLDPNTSLVNIYTISKGEIIIIPKNIYHYTLTNNKIVFISYLIKEKNASNNRSINSLLDNTANKPTIIKDIYLNTNKDFWLKSYNRFVLSLSNLTLTIVDYITEKGYEEDLFTIYKSNDRILNIENFLTENYSYPNALTLLANELHLSERQTQNIVKQITGQKFKDLVLKRKMETAKILIETTDISLNEISTMIGYNSYPSFYTEYLKTYNCSPAKHRSK